MLLRLELRMLASRCQTWLTVAALLAAMLIAARVGALHANAMHRDVAHAQAVALDAEQTAARMASVIAASGTHPEQYRDPTDPFGYPFYFARPYAVLPPLPLAALAAGESDVRPAAIRLVPGQAHAEGAAIRSNPHLMRIGQFDLAFVLVDLLPLAVIAMLGGTFATEWESGILLLMQIQPVSLVRIAAARFIASAILLVPAFILCFLIASASIGVPLGTQAAAMLAICAALSAYTIAWIAIIAAIAAWRIGAATALSLSIGSWISLVIAMPLLLANIADSGVPRLAGIDAERSAAASFDADPVTATQHWLGQTSDRASRADLQRLAQDAMVADRVAPYRRAAVAHDAALMRQSRWSLLSPALLLDSILRRLAGTDADRARSFLRGADAQSLRMERDAAPAIVARALDPASLRAAPHPSAVFPLSPEPGGDWWIWLALASWPTTAAAIAASLWIWRSRSR